MLDVIEYMQNLGQQARQASRALARAGTETKNQALNAMAEKIRSAAEILKQENERDLVEMPKNIKKNLDIRPVRWIDEVLEIALADQPTPRSPESKDESKATESKEENADDAKDGLRHH